MKHYICKSCGQEIKEGEKIIIIDGQAGYRQIIHTGCSNCDITVTEYKEGMEILDCDEDLIEVDLPKTIKIELDDDIDVNNKGEMAEYLANKISDKVGWCVNSFDWDLLADDRVLVSDIDWDLTIDPEDEE